MNLVDRVKNIVLNPKAEWAVIAPEQTDPQTLYKSYIAIVALVPVAAAFLSSLMFTGPMGMRIGFGGAVAAAVMHYILTLVMVLVVAFIADMLAPSFDGQKNLSQALKLTAYSMTAGWVAGAFVIVPWIGWLIALLGNLYALYIFFLGAPMLMKVPEQKAVVYTVVVVVIAIVVGVVIGMINAAILGMGASGMVGGMRPF
jgi:hypothetical protein